MLMLSTEERGHYNFAVVKSTQKQPERPLQSLKLNSKFCFSVDKSKLHAYSAQSK